MERLERQWMIACAAGGVVIHLALFFAGLHHQQNLGNPVDPAQEVVIFIFLIFFSLPITLFLLAIPSRLAMNLLIKERRGAKRCETWVLVFSFVAIGAAFLAMAMYREGG